MLPVVSCLRVANLNDKLKHVGHFTTFGDGEISDWDANLVGGITQDKKLAALR